jgi:hypothetical protein
LTGAYVEVLQRATLRLLLVVHLCQQLLTDLLFLSGLGP